MKGVIVEKAARVSVPLTKEERREIEAGMKATGIRSMSDFLRTSALIRARGFASVKQEAGQ